MGSLIDKFRSRSPKRLYCDYAAATPLLPAVAARMHKIATTQFGNPSAIHHEGAATSALVAEARASIAKNLGMRSDEVFFTATGSEANNLAIMGVVEAKRAQGVAYRDMRVITTKLEHPSVLKVVEHLVTLGVDVQYVAVTEEGVIDTQSLSALLSPQTELVTFAYANSEVGAVQPVKRISRLVRKYNTEHGASIVTHLDAAQAPLWLNCEPHGLGVDLMSLDAGKFHGPKGVGLLIKRSVVELQPLVLGGGQESGLRAGTENVAGVVGASIALQDAIAKREERVTAALVLREALTAAFIESDLNVLFNGPDTAGIINDTSTELTRIPNNVHISLPGFDTEYAVVYLDKHRIAASTKSACSGAGGGMSSVVYEMTGDTSRASSTIRFTLDPAMSKKNISKIVTTLEQFASLQNQIK